jgi:hypothetical protein
MSTVTLLDEIDDLERMLAGANAPIPASSGPGEWLRVAGDEEDEDDLFGEDDLGFDDVDDDESDEGDDELADDDELAEDADDEV